MQLSDSAAAAKQAAEDTLYRDVVTALGPKRLSNAEVKFVRADLAHYTDRCTYAPLWGDSSASAALWDGPAWAATHRVLLGDLSATTAGKADTPLPKELVHTLPPKSAKQLARRKAEDVKADAKLAATAAGGDSGGARDASSDSSQSEEEEEGDDAEAEELERAAQ